MAATILLLLAAGAAISTWQAVRAIRSENEARLLQAKAEEEEKKALKSADEARAMFRFFKEVTHEARFNVKEGNEWRPKTVEEAATVIDSEPIRALFSDKPLVESDIRQWIATGFDSDYTPVGKVNYDLIGVVFEEGTPKGPQTVDTHIGKEIFQRRFYYDRDSIRHHLERALELRSVHLGPNHPKTLDTMLLLGRANMFDNNPKALQLLGDLVARASATLGPVNAVTVGYRGWLARAYENAEKHDEALRLLEEIYLLTKNTLGVDDNNTLYCSDRLAEAYEKTGRIHDALRQREESLRGRRKESPGSNDFDLGYALHKVARLHERLHDYKRAEPLWREALPLLKTNESVLVDVQVSFGRCLLHTGKPAEAETVLRQCLTLREKTFLDDRTTFHTNFLLGRSLLEQKKYADAEPLLLAGYEGMKKATGVTDAERQSRLIENAERLVQLYEAVNTKDKADTWRKKLQEAKKATKTPAKP